ncbi:MAG: fatty acid desaturase [Gammaproteobacteria bacterium]
MVMQQESKLGVLIPHVLPILLFIGYLTEKPYLFILLSIVYLALLSALDNFKRDPAYPYPLVAAMPENEGELKRNWYWYMSLLFIILYLIELPIGIYYAQYKQPTLGWILYALPFGIVASSALNLCHEFMHTKYSFERIVSRIVASICFWSVHEYEHLFIHHNTNLICTEEDKSHARLNQSVYSFILQSLVYNYRDAWRVQKQLSQREGKSFYNIFYNNLLQTLLLSIIISLSVLLFVGLNGFIFFILQAIMAVMTFIIITYNQHYGLTRQKNAEGVYESFTIMNVWNSNHYFTSKLAFNLSHHSHHHKYQFCRYHHLKVIENAPQLPFGYALALVVVLIPPLWYKIMNKRVEDVFSKRRQYEREGMML